MYLKTTLALHLFFLSLIMSGQLVPLAESSQALIQSTTDASSLQMNRTHAYYLGSIPPYNAQSFLYFEWNVLLSTVVNGTGVLQFSQNNLNWSNLVAFSIVRGVSAGRQSIDSSWAKPGENYLRATSNLTLSPERTLLIIVNYGATLVGTLFLVVGVLLLVTVFLVALRRGRRRPTISIR